MGKRNELRTMDMPNKVTAKIEISFTKEQLEELQKEGVEFESIEDIKQWLIDDISEIAEYWILKNGECPVDFEVE